MNICFRLCLLRLKSKHSGSLRGMHFFLVRTFWPVFFRIFVEDQHLQEKILDLFSSEHSKKLFAISNEGTFSSDCPENFSAGTKRNNELMLLSEQFRLEQGVKL